MEKNKVILLELCSLKSERIDLLIVDALPNYSRTQIQSWIKSGSLKVNQDTITKPKFKTSTRDHIILETTLTERTIDEAQDITINVVYEDDAILVINKPVGLVTHPGAGIADNTLMNGLLYHCPDNKLIPRAGIVHRLDRDTSGIMVIAKNVEAYNNLVDAFKNRHIEKHYQAIVYGQFKLSKTIDAPIGRHPQQRTKMAVIQRGKHAISHITVLKRYTHFSHLKVNIETGRTHQIRVHLAHDKHPIVGDKTYGRKPNYTNLHPDIKAWLLSQETQLLHAHKISFHHPESNELMTFEAPLEENFEQGLTQLNKFD